MGKAARSRARRRANPDRFESTHAKVMDKMRMITLARTIKTPEQFDHILSQVQGGEAMRDAVRRMLEPHVSFRLRNKLRRLGRRLFGLKEVIRVS